jgi:hypothetical protein
LKAAFIASLVCSSLKLVSQVRLGELESLDYFAGWFEERAIGLPRLAYYQERRLRRLGLIDDGALSAGACVRVGDLRLWQWFGACHRPIIGVCSGNTAAPSRFALWSQEVFFDDGW